MTDYSKIFPPIEPRVLAIGTPGCAKCRGLILVGAEQCVVDDEVFSHYSGVPIGGLICRWCFFDMAEDAEDGPPKGAVRQ